jgi:hypothetical protein
MAVERSALFTCSARGSLACPAAGSWAPLERRACSCSSSGRLRGEKAGIVGVLAAVDNTTVSGSLQPRGRSRRAFRAVHEASLLTIGQYNPELSGVRPAPTRPHLSTCHGLPPAGTCSTCPGRKRLRRSTAERSQAAPTSADTNPAPLRPAGERANRGARLRRPARPLPGSPRLARARGCGAGAPVCPTFRG